MQQFTNILYVANSTEDPEVALEKAVAIARRNDAQLTLLLVVEPIPAYVIRRTPHLLHEERMTRLRDEMRALKDRYSDWTRTEIRIVSGKPFLEIIRSVLKHGHDLVVKPIEENDGVRGRLFGSTDMHLLRQCPCPLWLIKSSQGKSFPKIMAAVDGEAFEDAAEDKGNVDRSARLNRKILEAAAGMAALEEGELHVVHAWHSIGEHLMRGHWSGLYKDEIRAYVKDDRRIHKQWLDRLMHEARAWVGSAKFDAVNPQPHLKKGMAGEIIPALAEALAIDVIVMGTVARTGIAGLVMGNTAESILEKVQCSVLAVKPVGFETPVRLEG